MMRWSLTRFLWNRSGNKRLNYVSASESLGYKLQSTGHFKDIKTFDADTIPQLHSHLSKQWVSCTYPQFDQRLRHPTDPPISSNNMKFSAANLTALLCVSATLALPSPQSPVCDAPICGDDAGEPDCISGTYPIVNGDCYQCCMSGSR